MSPLWGNLIGVFIALMMLIFIGIWIWAWRPRHRGVFGRMSRLPMEDDALPVDHRVPPTRLEDRQ